MYKIITFLESIQVLRFQGNQSLGEGKYHWESPTQGHRVWPGLTRTTEELPAFLPSQARKHRITSHCRWRGKSMVRHPYLGAGSQGIPKSGNSIVSLRKSLCQTIFTITTNATTTPKREKLEEIWRMWYTEGNHGSNGTQIQLSSWLYWLIPPN